MMVILCKYLVVGWSFWVLPGGAPPPPPRAKKDPITASCFLLPGLEVVTFYKMAD